MTDPPTPDGHGHGEDGDLTHTDPPKDTYPEPERPVMVSNHVIAATIDTLNRCQQFFHHHASPAVHAELQAFVATLGLDAECGTDPLLDDLGFDALALHWALNPDPGPPPSATPSRDDPATMTCPACQTHFTPTGRQRYCSTACRKTAFRRRHQNPPTTVVIPPAQPRRHTTIYECPSCGQRLIGDQHCQPCRTFTRRAGIGGPCPHCNEPVVLADLLDQEVTIMPNR